MPSIEFLRSSTIKRTPRVLQLEGLFAVTPSPTSEIRWKADIPIDDFDWNIGVIVGPSGSGKSTLAHELFPEKLQQEFEWDPESSIVDSFPKEMGIKDITGLLSSVGFSSPPSWLRPFHVLSNGEQFRVNIARGLAESPDLLVVDEFTSVVDRTVAQIGSAAIAKAVRRKKQKFVAVSCHYDILEWLQPDWVYDPSTSRFARDCLRRPQISLDVRPVSIDYWGIFSKYHYLSHSCHRGSKCFCAFYKGRPIAFTSVWHVMHPTGVRWSEHRTVCLPDFQGIGIGNALANCVASAFSGVRGRKYTSVSGNPAMIAYRTKSPLWKMTRKPQANFSTAKGKQKKHKNNDINKFRKSMTTDRVTASFRYVGPRNPDVAKKLGIS